MKTPQQSHKSLASALDIDQDLYLKREDLHPYGSHKGRSIPAMIKHYLKEDDVRRFVISSSGNAALAAKLAVERHNTNNPDRALSLEMFVGKRIPEKKLSKLESDDERIRLSKTERPKQSAFAAAKKNGVINLRQSTDDIALDGYIGLAEELLKVPTLAAVFVPTSSGTCAQALGQIFVQKDPVPQLHIVQTGACHPIADMLGVSVQDIDQSAAGAIVDRVAHRKAAVADMITQTSGSAVVPTEEQIREAQTLLKTHAQIDATPNGALALAGLIQTKKEGRVFAGPVAVLVCGV